MKVKLNIVATYTDIQKNIRGWEQSRPLLLFGAQVRILDMSAGKRNIWWNRLYPDTVFVDLRPEMAPTVVADTRQLPFKPEIFDLVVFDPPHMVHGEGTQMAAYYGAFSASEIRDTVVRSSAEAYRCSRDNSFMAFKWNSHDVRIDHMIDLMEGWEPLFAHKVAINHGRKNSTQWVLLRKRGLGYAQATAAQRIFAIFEDKP